MAMPRLRTILLPVLLAATQFGCETPSRQESASTSAPFEVVALSTNLPPVIAVDVVPPAATNSVKAPAQSLPWPTNSDTHAWIPFQLWTDFNGFAKPHLINSGANPSYESRSSNAVLSITV